MTENETEGSKLSTVDNGNIKESPASIQLQSSPPKTAAAAASVVGVGPTSVQGGLRINTSKTKATFCCLARRKWVSNHLLSLKLEIGQL